MTLENFAKAKEPTKEDIGHISFDLCIVKMKAAWAPVILLLPWIIQSQPEESLPRDQWYQKYSVYPSLCSTPQQLEQRQIPPLLPPNQAYTSQLLHASVVIRHGARTPTSIHPCWKGYGDVGADTAVWNCDLVSLEQPHYPFTKDSYENETTFLYEKKYDALSSSSSKGPTNMLNGTCEVAQLLQRGYDQEDTNSQFLRKAYIWDDTSTSTDSRLVLFNLSAYNNQWFVPNEKDSTVHLPWDEPFTYFRSDDDQRTLMSGQVLLRGLFRSYLQNQSLNHSLWTSPLYPHITVHTADRSQDILAPNENQCPRLTILSQRAKQSREYKSQYIDSKELELMQKFAMSELGISEKSMDTFRDHALDCLITTICTDRNLPQVLHYGEAINDTMYGSDLFDRLINYAILPKTFMYRFNDSAYSKLSMIPLWQEIISHFPILLNNPSMTSDSKTKLALYSGHDTTLIPLLASLGQRVWDGSEWIPYASMMIIEIHDILFNNVTVNEISSSRKQFPSSKAFRLIYNGEVLTDRVDGCTTASDLCDVSFLMNRLLSFVQVDTPWSCELTHAEKAILSALYNEVANEFSLASSFIHTAGGKVILFLIIALSAFLSSLLTFVMMARKCPSWCCNRCCRRGQSPNLRDYESITFSPGTTKNDNFVKPGWNDPRRKTDFRYVEVPSWFTDEHHEIT